MLSEKIYRRFDGPESSTNLAGLCRELLSEQKMVWQDLREGCESLKGVRERNILCRGFSVRLQHNPGRIKSSLANVGEKNAKGRRCFLCLGHLPEGQKGILYRSEYLILCNPMPVFPAHFTVAHGDHRPQAIAENINTLLQLMTDFGSHWTILYNGPKCGASAADHLHFHAAPSGQMPIEKEIQEEKKLSLVGQLGSARLYRVKDQGREVIILDGDDPMAVGDALKAFLEALRKVLLINEEPMINVVGFQKEGGWRLVIFPREKHRPLAFFREGDARVVVSPGVIDMGGLLITPVEKDFERLDAAAVESIYREVSLDGKIVQRAMGAIG